MLRLLQFLSLLVLFSGIAYGQDQTLSCMVYEGPPYYFRKADGQWEGMNIELATALADRAQLQLQPREYPWNRALMFLESGDLDMMVELSKTSEREKYINFLGASFLEQYALIVRKDQAVGLQRSLLQLDDMKRPGYIWGIRENVSYSREFDARITTDPDFAGHFDAVSYTKVNVDRLRMGRLTGVLGPVLPVGYLVGHDPAYRA